MKLRNAACLAAALVMTVGSTTMAQNATAKPVRAPGVHVERISKLMVGDRAPKLQIQEWVKGNEVTSFEKGKVYVVEFWATWCGPCIAGMPHVSKVQEEYKDKGVTVIGVNIWDDPANVKPFMKDRGGDEKMQYTVAIEKKIKDGNIRYGEMANNWMKNAGQNGIPAAFIVDQNGYIAWIGHPGNLDKPLEQVVAKKWDIVKAATDFAKEAQQEAQQAQSQSKIEKIMQPIADAFDEGNFKAASKKIEKAIDDKIVWENPNLLNYMAWNMADPDGKGAATNPKLALKLAKQAAKLTDRKDPAILDTLAWAYYATGDKKMAVQTEKEAIGMVSGEEKEAYESALKKMTK